MKDKCHERVRFSLIQCPSCNTLLCWVNPRMPNYCPECGKQIWLKMSNRQCILFQDNDAWINHKRDSDALQAATAKLAKLKTQTKE